ncbi:hypothetical protein O181_094542 [Austropuccinia psidii MF-1]|uniref:Retrotransposon gag domain-containing protein n=1 Tax=Austropuccinia psidii MF-1 TaxID=1389203 RepID=A0A9Q3PBL5_9BASI|nr:hypothetical protein [Austropuccinia psidii MF-1]
MGQEKKENLLRGWKPISCKEKVQQIKETHVFRGPEDEVGPRKGQQPSRSSPSLHKQKSISTSTKKGKENPKEQSEGQAKGKGKGKAQVEQALPTELQNYQKREDSHGQCIQYGKNSDGIQKQQEGKKNPILSKEIDLVKLSTVTLLNQPDDIFISFITKQLRELRIQVQNLENSTCHNAALFQEQLEKSDEERLELKEDIKSSINNISLKNELPRQSTPILDRIVLNLNNDLHHIVSSNSEVKTACNFKEISRLEELPTFSGEGEYNNMEFMKTFDMFKEDFNISDEYISATLHSLFTKSAKKWYYKMKQDHGKHSSTWWNEKVISEWKNYSWRFNMENSFEESIFDVEREGPMSHFLKQKDRLTSLHPDMSKTMIHKIILKKCGDNLEHAIRSRCIEPFSTEDYINAMEDIKTRTKLEEIGINPQ